MGEPLHRKASILFNRAGDASIIRCVPSVVWDIFSPAFQASKSFLERKRKREKVDHVSTAKLAIMPAAHANGPLWEFSSAQLSSLIRPPIFPLDPRSDGGREERRGGGVGSTSSETDSRKQPPHTHTRPTTYTSSPSWEPHESNKLLKYASCFPPLPSWFHVPSISNNGRGTLLR